MLFRCGNSLNLALWIWAQLKRVIFCTTTLVIRQGFIVHNIFNATQHVISVSIILNLIQTPVYTVQLPWWLLREPPNGCTEKYNNTGNICEIPPPTTSQWATTRVRTYTGCPPRAIHLADTCIRVYIQFGKIYKMFPIFATYRMPPYITFQDS